MVLHSSLNLALKCTLPFIIAAHVHGLQEKLLQPVFHSAGPPAMAVPHLPAFPWHLVRASRADETQGEGSEGVPPPARGPHTDVP